MANTSRFSSNPAKENTARVLTYDYQTPAYAGAIALTVREANTTIKPGTLTGNPTFSVNVVSALTSSANDGPFIGDTITFHLASDGTTRTATFGTGFLPTGTLAVTTGKYAIIKFEFNGTGWIEAFRAVSA